MNYQITEYDNIIIKSFQDFIKDDNPVIPLCQREYIEERVNYFYNKIINYVISDKYNDKYPIPFFNMIYCGKYNNNIYILDGQHRYYAYKKYYNETKKNFNIIINIKNCNSQDEIKDYFRELNNNYILHDLILDETDMDKTNEIKSYMKIKYSKHLSNSEVPRYPNINLDQFCNYLLQIFKNIPVKNIIEKMEELNNAKSIQLKETNFDLYQSAKKKQGFYLGYIFIKNENDIKRKKIPTTVRHKLWRQYYQDSMNGNCYLCMCNITIENYHAGHIISVRNGGTNNIDNLKIVCSLCNLSMGTQNLEEFKQRYF
jgi:hypothetical protein